MSKDKFTTRARPLRIEIRDIPPLSEHLEKYKDLRAELTYIARRVDGLSPDAMTFLLPLHPIVIADTTEGRRTVGGSRSWAIAKLLLPAREFIQVFDLQKIDEEHIYSLAITDSLLSGIFFNLTSAGIKQLEVALRQLDQEDRKRAATLLPGASTQKAFSMLTGLRDSTSYERERASRQSNTDKGNDNV